MPPYWWGSVNLQVGVVDLTCARSVVRHWVPFVHPVDRSRRFGHVNDLAVRRNSVGFTWRADQAFLESDPTHCISPHSPAGTSYGSAASIEAATRKAFVLVRPYRGSLSLSFRSDQRGS
ncbi:hypothetical protein BHE74_00035457 [Ensete ventricosum]|nr:hypothetical protein BHE74_00035457 [Ensete ventricosum]